MFDRQHSGVNCSESREISLWSQLHGVSFFRRSARSRISLVLATVLGGALLAPGCILEADECLEGDARCDGAVAQVCLGYERGARRVAKWSSTDCSDRICVATPDASGRPQAFCALSSQPDVRCVEPDGASCDGKSLVACRAGRATEVAACSTSCITLDDLPDYCGDNPPANVHCVGGDGCELASPGISAMSGNAPGAVCSPSEFGPASDPNTKIYSYSCEDGLLTRRDRCASACVDTAQCTTHCAK